MGGRASVTLLAVDRRGRVLCGHRRGRLQRFQPLEELTLAVHPETPEDGGQVVAHGVLTEKQVTGDGRGPLAGHEALEDLVLTGESSAKRSRSLESAGAAGKRVIPAARTSAAIRRKRNSRSRTRPLRGRAPGVARTSSGVSENANGELFESMREHTTTRESCQPRGRLRTRRWRATAASLRASEVMWDSAVGASIGWTASRTGTPTQSSSANPSTSVTSTLMRRTRQLGSSVPITVGKEPSKTVPSVSSRPGSRWRYRAKAVWPRRP